MVLPLPVEVEAATVTLDQVVEEAQDRVIPVPVKAATGDKVLLYFGGRNFNERTMGTC